MREELSQVIWQRLQRGQSLDGLGLGTVHGRLDLRSLRVPQPVPGKALPSPLPSVKLREVSGVQKVVGRFWRGLDFSGAHLEGLAFMHCDISDCVFDRCKCQGWSIWATEFRDVSFRGADLREAMLGGVADKRQTSFVRADFDNADMRSTYYGPGPDFRACSFRSTKLHKVEFGGSRFEECIFEGELREVLFYGTDRLATQAGLPPNRMLHVDLRRARLRWCAFRGLDLDTVLFPLDDEHIILNNYRVTLDRILAAFAGRTDEAARVYTAVLGSERKWAAANQQRGVLNKLDLLEMGGPEGLEEVMGIIRASEGADVSG